MTFALSKPSQGVRIYRFTINKFDPPSFQMYG